MKYNTKKKKNGNRYLFFTRRKEKIQTKFQMYHDI